MHSLPMIVAPIALVGLVAVAGSAAASVVTHMDLDALVRTSSVIVRGDVESVESRLESGRLHTSVTIRVDEGLKGAAAGGRVTLRQPGGSAGGYTRIFPGVPAFQAGERVVVFAEPLKTGALTVTGLFQGKYRIVDAGGQPMVVRESSGHEARVVGGSGAPDAAQPLAEFLDRVRALVARSPGQPVSSHPDAPDGPGGGRAVEPFTLLGPTRWFEFDSGAAVSWLFSPTAAPAGVPGGARAGYVSALAAWTNVPGTSVSLIDAGDSAPGCILVLDGRNAVVHGDPCDEMPSFDSATCSGVLALGGPGFSSVSTKTVNGVVFNQIVEGDVALNAGADCFWSGAGNYAEVVFHEMGHALGLGHACGGSSGIACTNPVLDDAAMRAFAHGDGRGASPRTDDVDGIHFIYAYALAALDQATFDTGQTMTLTVAGNLTAVSDIYVVVVMPDGTFFSLGPGLALGAPNTLAPLAAAVPALGAFGPVTFLTHTFGGGEAGGAYLWAFVIAPSGVSPLTALIAVDVVGFTFTP